MTSHVSSVKRFNKEQIAKFIREIIPESNSATDERLIVPFSSSALRHNEIRSASEESVREGDGGDALRRRGTHDAEKWRF